MRIHQSTNSTVKFLRNTAVIFILGLSFMLGQSLYTFRSVHELMNFQQTKEREAQELINQIFGQRRVIIKVKIRSHKETVPPQDSELLILPGVPIQQNNPPDIHDQLILDRYDITLWVDRTVRNIDALQAQVRNFFDFDLFPQSSMQIFRESFPAPDDPTQRINSIINNSADKLKSLLDDNTLNIAINFKDAEQVLRAIVSTKLEIKDFVWTGVGFSLIIILVMSVYTLFKMYSSSLGLKKPAGDSQAVVLTKAPGEGTDDESDEEEMEDELSEYDEMQPDEAVEQHFSFINENNIFKMAYVLEQDKPHGGNKEELEEYWQNIAIITSFLPKHLSNILFSKFSTEEQSEIIPYLTYEIEYPMSQLIQLEENLKKRLDTLVLVGGKHAVLPILENFSNEKKSEIAMALHVKHPDVLSEIRDMIVLFEDLISLPEQDRNKLFMEMDPNMLAMCLIEFPEAEREYMMGGLAEGLQAMIKEVIELRKDNYTDVEVQDAKDTLIKTARIMNRKGIIELKKKEFSVNEVDINQNEIDSIFNDIP